MHILTFLMQDSQHPSFEDAFKALYQKAITAVQGGSMSWQALETSVWIKSPGKQPLYFYDARDRAYDLGLLQAGGVPNWK
jgi:hypothetical protein